VGFTVTPGIAAIATGSTRVSLSNTAVSVSPNESLIGSRSTTAPVLRSTVSETSTSVSGKRVLNATASAAPSPSPSM